MSGVDGITLDRRIILRQTEHEIRKTGCGVISPLRHLRLEGTFNWVADDSRDEAVIPGVPTLLCADVVRGIQLDGEYGQGVHLEKEWSDDVNTQSSCKNSKYPWDVAFAAFRICNRRWYSCDTERLNLVRELPLHNDIRMDDYTYVGIGSDRYRNDVNLRTEDSIAELSGFDVITTSTVLRNVIRFLYPQDTPYLLPFQFDVDLVGTTCVLSALPNFNVTTLGYGLSFERFLVQRPTIFLSAERCRSPGNKGRLRRTELTSLRAIRSFSLGDAMRLAVCSELDAISHDTLPAPECRVHGTTLLDPCFTGQQKCRDDNINGCENSAGSHEYERQVHGWNPCYVQRHQYLLPFEKQLLQGKMMVFELKTRSTCRVFPWSDALEQMQLAGSTHLIVGWHTRGRLGRTEMFSALEVERQVQYSRSHKSQPERKCKLKWLSLRHILLQLRDLANEKRDESGTARLRVSYDGISEYLTIVMRSCSSFHFSKEAETWLKYSSN